jgi:DNA-binding MarR family transcriptional regulator
MPTILGQLTRATNLLTHHLEDRLVETGLYATEYLVLRTASMDRDATATQVRHSLALRDAAFSDVVRRAVDRGYVRFGPPPRDRRTRRFVLTVPGDRAVRIAAGIQQDLEAHLGHANRQLEIFESLNKLGDAMAAIPAATILEDGLPLATA